MTRGRLAGAAAVALLVAVAAGWLLIPHSSVREWTNDPGSFDRLAPDALWTRPADGLNDRRLITREELRSQYPFEVELPSTMPPGYRLLTVTFIEAGHPANPQPPSWLSAQYAVVDGGPDIRVNQAAGENLPSTAGAEQTHVRDAPAFYSERTVEGLRFDWLYWVRCGRTFAVQSNGGAFSRAELVRIAESIGPEDCSSG